MSTKREPGPYWAKLRAIDERGPAAWSIVSLRDGGWVDVLGDDQVYREENITEWGPCIYAPDDPRAPVLLSASLLSAPAIVAPMPDAPECRYDDAREIELLREAAAAAKLVWRPDIATALPRLTAALEALDRHRYPLKYPRTVMGRPPAP